MGLQEELVGRDRQLQQLGEGIGIIRHQAHREGHKIRVHNHLFLHDGVEETDLNLAAFFRYLGLAINLIGDKDHTHLAGLKVRIFGKTIGAHIPVEDDDLRIWIDFLDLQNILQGVITADLGAVIQIITARTGTLNHDQGAGRPGLGLTRQLLLQLLLGDNLFGLAEQILVRAMLTAAGGDNDDAMVNCLLSLVLALAAGNHRGKVADKSGGLHQLRIADDIYVFGSVNFGDQALQVRLHLVACQGMVQILEITADTLPFFNEDRIKSLLGKVQGGGHSRYACPYNQGLGCYRYRLLGQRLNMSGLGNGHAHQILGLDGGKLRLSGMNPGTLVADIDHLKEVPVQTGIAQGLLKERLMGTRRTGCYDHPVQLVLLDLLLDNLLGILGTGVEVFGIIGDIHHIPGVVGHRGHIHHRADIDAAMADKDTDSGLIVFRHHLLLWICLELHTFAPHLFQGGGSQ